MARRTKEKQVILFLVEGPNDEIALIQPLKSLLNGRFRAFSAKFYCDVTIAHLYPGSDYVKTYNDICETVRRFVIGYLETERGYRWGDIAEIVHIVDTDGAFIPDECVVQDDFANAVEYSADKIRCPNRKWIVKRNQEKGKAIGKLVRTRVLTWKGQKIAYRLLYCSRNFEHAFCGLSGNLSDAEKDKLAQGFRRKYEGDPLGFEQLLNEVGRYVSDDYQKSWSFIQQGCHSLERHSNMHLVLDRCNG